MCQFDNNQVSSPMLGTYRKLFADLGLLVSATGNEAIPISNISFDTRELQPGTLFFCKGVHFKPEYLRQAAREGAVAYCSEVVYEDVDLPRLIVSDIRSAMNRAALLHFDHPTDKLTTIGITGTKGKSTVAYYVKQILDTYLEKPCGIMSTIDNFDGTTTEESHLTTQESIPLMRHAFTAVNNGLSHMIIEASSQALKYQRVDGITFTIGCMHNIGTDHISPAEHPDFADYFASKLRILSSCRIGCINSDADHFEETRAYAAAHCQRFVIYGSHPTDDIYGYHVKKREDGIFFTVRTPHGTDDFCLTMPGLFNVSNALAAIAICDSLGVPLPVMKEALRTARVSGRMEAFDSRDRRVTVIVDYAHNRMSFEALFHSIKEEYPNRKILTVFGCPGVKALNRRRDLGELAGRYSDFVVITEEDTGDEPFSHIADEIARYVGANGCPFTVIENRGDAIREAVLNHEGDRVILITGKGRETRQRRGTTLVATPSDADYGEKYLHEYDERTASVGV